MTESDIKQLERNVKDLQEQLQNAYIRIGELNDLLKIEQEKTEFDADDWRKGTLWEKK
jgi:hypothetical protein